jgi:hypothetical protein
VTPKGNGRLNIVLRIRHTYGNGDSGRGGEDMKKNMFDTLREWATLSDDELSKVFARKGAAKTLSSIVHALGAQLHKNQTIDSANAPRLVREMRELLSKGSRELSAVMSKASHYKDEGRDQEAVSVYRDFMASCPSDFYKAIAQKELDYMLLSGTETGPRQVEQVDLEKLNRLLKRSRTLLGKCARQIADQKINSKENLLRICEADRYICDIQADIEQYDRGKE